MMILLCFFIKFVEIYKKTSKNLILLLVLLKFKVVIKIKIIPVTPIIKPL